MGVEAIVIGNFVSTFICYFINAYLPGKMFNFGVRAQFKIFWKIVIASAIMAVSVWASMLIVDSGILKLIIGIISGAIMYAIVSKVLKIREFEEIIRIISSRICKSHN